MSAIVEPSAAEAGGADRPRMSVDEVRRLNTLVATSREVAFPWADLPARLSFVAAAPAPQPHGGLRLRLDGHELVLGLPALPELASVDVGFAGIEIAALPDELLAGILEAWLDEPLQALQQRGHAVTIEGWTTGEPALAARCGWRIARGDDLRFFAGTVHAGDAALDHLAALVRTADTRPERTGHGLPCTVSVAVAALPLPLAALRAVGNGDVLLLPVRPADLSSGRRELWVAGRRLASAIRSERSLRIEAMNASSPASATSPAEPLAVDDLPVHVLFDVGQIETTVGQLRTLAEGYTFELPEAADRGVTLRINGREVGRGEIVEIGDKLGVRIVAWNLT